MRKEKKCKNPECDSLIQYYENPKKFFCGLSCKNRYHYLKDLYENAEIISFENSLKTNYKFIKNLIKKFIYVVDADVAKAMGLFKVKLIIDDNRFSTISNRCCFFIICIELLLFLLFFKTQ